MAHVMPAESMECGLRSVRSIRADQLFWLRGLTRNRSLCRSRFLAGGSRRRAAVGCFALAALVRYASLPHRKSGQAAYQKNHPAFNILLVFPARPYAPDYFVFKCAKRV
jgi:hypothetical protein